MTFGTLRLKLIGLTALLGLVSMGAQSWDLNDVSYLLPLPGPEQFEDLAWFRPSSVGSAGDLLPRVALEQLPPLANILTRDQAYSLLRVVGVRVDPDFAGTGRAQIRMVWQPVVARTLTDGRTQVLTVDCAVHTFYELSRVEFSSLTAKLQELKQQNRISTAGLPLGVHPVLSSQGMGGVFGSALARLFLSYSGARRLSRITVMTLEGRANQWNFSGVDLHEGKSQPIIIPRVEALMQVFTNSMIPPSGFFGGAFPAASRLHSEDAIDLLLSDSENLVSHVETPELRQIANAVHRIENPLIHSPENVDCVSCHTSQQARLWLDHRIPELHALESPFKFAAPQGMDFTNHSDTQRFVNGLRAFGYQGMKPAVSQRVIHESAAVAQALNVR
jgi:hypothetical protein